MRYFWIVVSLMLFASMGHGEIRVDAESVCMIDGNTGEVLYAKEADSLKNPASITKIATALYLFAETEVDLDATVIADQDSVGWISAQKKKKANYALPAYWLEPDGTHLGIQKGEEVKIRDLLYGMMVGSYNDCSNLLAKQVFGEIPLFMDKLNAFLKREVGCHKTHFMNPHGLFHPDHKTTAYDMALIAKEAMNFELFRSLVASKEYVRQPTNKNEGGGRIRQTNKLIRPGKLHYKNAIGVKTGYIQAAKHTFVGAAEKEGRLLIAVLLGNPDREQMFLDTKRLLEEGFRIPRYTRRLFATGPQNFEHRVKKGGRVKGALREEVVIHYYEGKEPDVRCQVEWKGRLQAPLERDELVGHLLLKEGDQVLQRIPVYAAERVERYSEMWSFLPGIVGCCVVFLMTILVWEVWKKR